MRIISISILALIALTFSCSSLEPISISQDSGMSILANVSDNQDNSTGINSSINQSSSNQTAIAGSSSKSDLWSWGTIPEGYTLNKNGTLTKMADEEWKPSI